MEKARIVLRESTEALKEGFGFDNQRAECTKFTLRHNVEVTKEHRLVESSSSWKRDKFEEIINEAIAERDAIPWTIFPRVDRFARNLEAAGYYLGLLRRNELKVAFAEEDLVVCDESSTTAVLMVFMHGFKADQDGKQIKSNMLAGRDKVGSEKHQLPNGMVIWSFDYVPKRLYGIVATGRPTLNLEKTAWVRKWVDWILNEGIGELEVCRRMEKRGILAPKGGKSWSSSTVSRILRSRQLIGEFHWKGKRIYEQEGETVLSTEQFDALQKRLDEVRESSYYNAAKLDYPPLRGMVFCQCGRRMGGCPQHGYPYYRCAVCRKPLINAQWLWRMVERGIKSELFREDNLIPAIEAQLESSDSITSREKDLRALNTRIEVLNDKWDALYRLASLDYPEDRFRKREQEIITAINEAADEQDHIEREVSLLKQKRLDKEGIARFCQVVARNADSLMKAQWEMLLKILRFKIVVYGKELITVYMALPPIRHVENEFTRL